MALLWLPGLSFQSGPKFQQEKSGEGFLQDSSRRKGNKSLLVFCFRAYFLCWLLFGGHLLDLLYHCLLLLLE